LEKKKNSAAEPVKWQLSTRAGAEIFVPIPALGMQDHIKMLQIPLTFSIKNLKLSFIIKIS
jgi:hypothetical protein